MLITGYATPEGTARFKKRFEDRLPGHFRDAHDLWLSSIGIGTYLGEADARYDELYASSVTRALELGVNVVDSAVNYRHQRSERSIGRALAALVKTGRIKRDEVFLSTKGGFLSFDGEAPADPPAYFYEQIIGSGLGRPEEIAANCHVISPAWLAKQIDVSRANLGVETIDLYYVHNPETQLASARGDAFYERLRNAFIALEEAVAAGKIRMYGAATWNGFRAASGSEEFISLAGVLRAAREAAECVGAPEHHFDAIQLPFNMAMPEALTRPTQPSSGGAAPPLRAAAEHHLMAFASASLLQGKLAEDLPEKIARRFTGLTTDAQRSIQFVRSTPGITTALVGMSDPRHVEENLGAAAVAPMTAREYRAVFS